MIAGERRSIAASSRQSLSLVGARGAGTTQPFTASSDACAPAGDDDSHMGEKEAVEKLRELEQEAEVGESAKTPFIVLADVWVVAAAAVAVVLVLSFIAYWIAAR
jgi:hypothetical protein